MQFKQIIIINANHLSQYFASISRPLHDEIPRFIRDYFAARCLFKSRVLFNQALQFVGVKFYTDLILNETKAFVIDVQITVTLQRGEPLQTSACKLTFDQLNVIKSHKSRFETIGTLRVNSFTHRRTRSRSRNLFI